MTADAWVRRTLLVAAACLLLAAAVPGYDASRVGTESVLDGSPSPWPWRPIWDNPRWSHPWGAFVLAAPIVAGLGALVLALLRRAPAWAWVALCGVAAVATHPTWSSPFSLLHRLPFALVGMSAVAAGSHLRRVRPESSVLRATCVVGGLMLVVPNLEYLRWIGGDFAGGTLRILPSLGYGLVGLSCLLPRPIPPRLAGVALRLVVLLFVVGLFVDRDELLWIHSLARAPSQTEVSEVSKLVVAVLVPWLLWVGCLAAAGGGLVALLERRSRESISERVPAAPSEGAARTRRLLVVASLLLVTFEVLPWYDTSGADFQPFLEDPGPSPEWRPFWEGRAWQGGTAADWIEVAGHPLLGLLALVVALARRPPRWAFLAVFVAALALPTLYVWWSDMSFRDRTIGLLWTGGLTTFLAGNHVRRLAPGPRPRRACGIGGVALLAHATWEGVLLAQSGWNLDMFTVFVAASAIAGVLGVAIGAGREISAFTASVVGRGAVVAGLLATAEYSAGIPGIAPVLDGFAWALGLLGVLLAAAVGLAAWLDRLEPTAGGLGARSESP